MSFLSKLKIENIEYNVMMAEYTIEQSHDGTGLPNERPQAGQITVRIASVKTVELMEWANSSNMLKDGELVLYNRDSVSTFRSIEFKGAYCLRFTEKFDGYNNDPLYSEITISARTLKAKELTYENDWPTTV